MEAAKPVSLITPENNYSLSSQKEFKLFHENTEYIIEVGKSSSSDKLGIKLKKLSTPNKFNYSKFINLEELQRINKSFRYFDSINEAISSVQDLFEEKNVNLKIENDNIFLILKIHKIGKGEDLISLQLEQNSLTLEEICENLSQEVTYLKNKVNELEKENSYYKKENSNYKNEIDLLKKDIIALEEENNKRVLTSNDFEEINNQEIQVKNNIQENIDSKIITQKEELDFISNRIKKMKYFKNKKIFYELIFRATRDGGSSINFHQKCDGKAKTITIIKTIKGLKFGGYIDKAWSNNGFWITDDENCFIFSLDLKKIYNPIKGRGKYYFDLNCGPNFAEFGLKSNLFDMSSINIWNKKEANKFFTKFNSDYEINGGEKEFQAEEIELFKINI